MGTRPLETRREARWATKKILLLLGIMLIVVVALFSANIAANVRAHSTQRLSGERRMSYLACLIETVGQAPGLPALTAKELEICRLKSIQESEENVKGKEVEQ